MKQMRAAAFKARCLSVMKQVQATGEPVMITRRGTPLVRVVPVEPDDDRIFGFLKGKVRILGDIESPIPARWGTGKP